MLSSWITCMHMLRANMYCTAYLLKILFRVWNTCYWLKDTSVFVNRCLKVRKYLLDFEYYHVQVPPRLINNYYLMFLSNACISNVSNGTGIQRNTCFKEKFWESLSYSKTCFLRVLIFWKNMNLILPICNNLFAQCIAYKQPTTVFVEFLVSFRVLVALLNDI